MTDEELANMRIKDRPNKVRAKLIIDVEGEFYDDESAAETLRYCVEQDLEDAGFNVIDSEIFDLDKHDEEIIKNTVESIWGEPCEDCISREDAKNLFWDGTEGYDCKGFTRMEIGEMLDDLPSVTPQQKVGTWKVDSRIWRCSNCDASFDTWRNEIVYKNYCPNCGAKMEVEG